MTDLRQAATLALEALENERYVSAEIVDAITALKAALAQPEPAPVAIPDCGEAGHADGACGTSKCLPSFRRKTTPPAAQWDKPSASFNAWWDSNDMPPANPFAEGSAAYWAWAGWQAAQRKWQGLTDEELLEACQLAERGNYLVAFQRIQAKLKERNT